MQPRSLESILAGLDSTYNPQIDAVRARQAEIPNQVAAEEQGLQARQQTAFGDILNGARRRGTGVAFGGIPLAEQSRYTADNYLPALARLKQSGREQAMSLEDAILGIQERRRTQGQSIYEGERNFAEQQRQFNEQLAFNRQQAARQAAAANSFAPTLAGGGTPQKQLVSQRQDKGFNFTDATGRPISAAQYAAGTGVPFRQLLQYMANAGDAGAKAALGFVGDDFGYDPRKIGGNANLYNNLVWGTGKSAKDSGATSRANTGGFA